MWLKEGGNGIKREHFKDQRFQFPNTNNLEADMFFQSVAATVKYSLTRWPEICIAFICFLSITWYLNHKNKVLVHWPVVDMLPSLIQNAHRVHEWTVDISNTFGCTKMERGPFFGRLDMLFTCDPRNVEYIVRTNFANYPKGADYNKTFDILGEGLFNVDFELWHTQRITARMAFASNNFRMFIANFSRDVVKDALIPLLSHVARESCVVDLEDVFMRYTFDVTVATIFGRNPKCLSTSFPSNEFAQAMDNALEAVFFRHVTPRSWWMLCRWLLIGKERTLNNAWKTIDRNMAHYISLKKEDFRSGEEGADLLATYMKLQDDPRNVLLPKGDKFLRDAALSFLFAGRDTTGAGLSWFLWLVSKNPHSEAKILEELRPIVSKNSKCDLGKCTPYMFDSEDLKGLVYLHAALCESLRLYPSLPLNRKGALQADVLPDGTAVRPGTTVVMSTFAMARMEWIWGKDCLEFIPERWMDENGNLSHEAMNKFFTFSVGPRTCLGRNMAFTVIKTAAAAVLFNFNVEVVQGHVVAPKPSLVLRMKHGLPVRVKARIH